MKDMIHTKYIQIEEYAKSNQLESVQKALPMIYEIMNRKARNESAQKRNQTELLHSLEVCCMLIDLYIPISPEEMDALLAAVLLHIYPENFAIEDLEDKLVQKMGFSEQIYEIVDTLIPARDLTEEDQKKYYEHLQENKLALLAILADRGNIIQHLYEFSTWNAHRYIEETKACYYPMCIYGKEHHYELMATISVLMEKIRSLLEVAEILLRRYEVRESELIQDILALQEENATIRGIIQKFKEE